jgi:hypothetical protein
VKHASPAVLVVIAVAAALRLWGLGGWSLDGDELYSYYDVQQILAGGAWPEGVSSHPLGYLGMAVFGWLGGLGEFALRLFPALCGLGAVVLLAAGRRDVVPPGAALVAASLAALSPWLVYHAQTARFYGPLLLFATLATLWALPGPGSRPWRAALAWFAALLCHPSALLLGPALLLPALLRPGPARRRMVVPLVVVVALALWLASGSSTVVDVVRKGLERDGMSDYGPLHFLFGLGYNAGPAVGLLALLGLLAVLRSKHPCGSALAMAGLLPPAVLLVIGLLGVSMHQRYAMASMPALLVLAGWGLSAMWPARRVLAVGLGVLALAVPLPALMAHASDGNRHDMRGAALRLEALARPTDVVVADEHATLELYLQARPRFGDIRTFEAPVSSRRMGDFLGGERDVWLLLKASRMGGTYGAEFMDWLERYFS